MHDMINVDVIILFRFILTQFIFSCLYIQHSYCVSVIWHSIWYTVLGRM